MLSQIGQPFSHRLRFCGPFVAQDLRGRFKSKGHHAVIFHNDGWSTPHDGHDALDWIARQAWCNGKIGSTGGSALGITQNMAAPGAPPALAAQFVVVAFSDMYRQGAYQGGAFRTGLLENWLKATGMADVNLKTFVAHPRYDQFWEELNAEPQAGNPYKTDVSDQGHGCGAGAEVDFVQFRWPDRTTGLICLGASTGGGGGAPSVLSARSGM